jgi:WD40 repeat protein
MVNTSKSLTRSLGFLGVALTVGCMYYSALDVISSQNLRGEIVGSAVFSPDGATLYGAGTCYTPNLSEDRLTAWDTQTGKRLWRHTPPDSLGKLSISHSGKLLLTTSGHHLSLYDTQTGRLVRKFTTPSLSYASSPAQFLPGDKQILMVGQDAKLVVLDVTSGKQVRQLKHKPSEGAFALSPDGKSLALHQNESLLLLDSQTEKPLFTQGTAKYDGWPYSVTPVVFLPDGKRIRFADQLWNPSAHALRPLVAKDKEYETDALSPDGKRSVSLEWNGGRRVQLPLGTITGPGEKKIDLEGQTGW